MQHLSATCSVMLAVPWECSHVCSCSVSKLWDQVHRALAEMDILHEQLLFLGCPCSSDRAADIVVALRANDIRNMEVCGHARMLPLSP